MKNIRIKNTDIRFVREPLLAPFGFKGKYLTELWQTVARIDSENFSAACPCTISVLWSDAEVFASCQPDESSALMRDVTARALEMIKGESFVTPNELISQIFPELKKYADKICGRDVAETFVLNSLVGVDYALWSIYAKENGITDFDDIIPEFAREAMSQKHTRLAHIPLVSYAVDENGLKGLLDSGTALLKIKIGKACGENLTKSEDMKSMLEWDKARLSTIHSIADRYESDMTVDRKIRYYLDANGRYDDMSRLEALLDHADKIGALSRIELIEEPFAPENEIYVGNLPVTINADESAHSLTDVQKRLELGYKAVALKPIAKTMSVSFDMVTAIHKAGGLCLCADLTVVPMLAEWNKQFAARINPLSGLNCGCIEINGNQNYKNWDALCKMLPNGLEYKPEKNGRIELGDEFYKNGALLFENNEYLKLF
ncbi:MAG: mandelate racemase/muconate lactonizing enzyme family protein [Clostridia bacterium]|nr:mandelate racemase/muconate lactonizing enzyme family protein [Clostridia bacterium]